MRIVLGSSSHRRKEILKSLFPPGFLPTVVPPNIDEKAIHGSSPSGLTMAIARAKNEAVQRRLAYPAVVITADTVAVMPDGSIREKPVDADQEREFLKSYQSLMPVRCITSIWVVNTLTRWDGSVTDEATVHFKPFDDARREVIVAVRDFYSASGGFIIEHPLMKDLIESIDGDPETVQGLPGRLVSLLLEDALGRI